MKDHKGEAARWLAQAEYDLRAAQTNADNALYSYACFIAQQAAEKAFKAFLYAQGARQVTVHSVGALGKQVTKVRKHFAALARRASKLDRLYIPTRYPNGLPDGIPAEEYDEQDATVALNLARQVVDAIKKELNV